MEEIYRRHERKRYHGKIIEFKGVDGYTVYNTTPPLWLNVEGQKKRIIAGRVERMDEWAHSRIMFFKEFSPFDFRLIKNSPIITGEDPSITMVGGKIVLSVVLVKALFPKKNQCLFNTVYYSGDDIHELEPQPKWTLPGKNNRLVEIDDGIAVATRPQGKIGGKGTMAYIELPSLAELSEDSVKDAQLLKGLFGGGWGGPNELNWIPKTNSIAVLGHGAFQKKQKKIYFASFFQIIRDPQNKKIKTNTNFRIIAVRDNFLPGPAKNYDLKEVVFPTGFIFKPDKHPLLFAGLGDYSQGYCILVDKEIRGLY